MKTRRQHFVEFLLPGTLFDETTEKPIESWDIKTAVKMAKNITERHGSRPYGFVFKTKIVSEPVDDGEGGKLDVQAKIVETSGTHYIDGELKRFEDVTERIAQSNMRGNRWPLAVETTNGYRHMGIFGEDDRIVSKTGNVIASGKDAALVKYRAEKIAEWNATP